MYMVGSLDRSQTISLHFKEAPASTPKRLERLLLPLEQYDCETGYKPGKEMLLVDTLSRAYLEDYERWATEAEVECIDATH